MATVTRESIGTLNDKLTVNLGKEDYMPSFEKSLKTYAKNANIPGFRKGMVPTGVVKKMYGQSVFIDEVLRTVEKELNTYVEKEKLDIFTQPLPFENDSRMLDMNNPGDYVFAFEIGLKPDINIDLNNLSGTFYKVDVTNEMLDDEINRLRSRYGKMTEPETINNEEDVLNVEFVEADANGNIIENGIKKDNSLLLKYFSAELQEQLKGKKKDDVVLVQLNKAFEEKERDWVTEDLGIDKTIAENAEKFFNLTITKIGFVEKAELNEELFKSLYPQGNVTNEEELRNAVKEEIQKYYDAQSSHQLQDELYHHLTDNTKIEFPEKFLKRWLEEGAEKKVTPEEADKELPNLLNSLKWNLLSTKLINENNIKVEPDEVKNYARRQLAGYLQGQNINDAPWLDEYAERMMKDKKFLDETYPRLQTEKLLAFLESKTNKKEEAISLSEFEKNCIITTIKYSEQNFAFALMED